MPLYETTDAHGVTLSSSDSATYWGMEFTANIPCDLKSVIKNSSATPVDVGLLRINGSSAELIATATFSTDTATFEPNIPLQTGVTYALYGGTAGGTFTRRYNNSTSYPYTKKNITFISGFFTNASLAVNTATVAAVFSSIITVKNDGTIQGSTGQIGTRAIDKDYPYVEGITGGTTKAHKDKILEPQESVVIQGVKGL